MCSLEERECGVLESVRPDLVLREVGEAHGAERAVGKATPGTTGLVPVLGKVTTRYQTGWAFLE